MKKTYFHYLHYSTTDYNNSEYFMPEQLVKM